MKAFLPKVWLPTLLLLGSCVTPADEQDEVRAKLQAVLEQAAASQKSPGMVMAVQMGNSEPMFFTTGFQDEQKTLPMTIDQKFRVGSITKNFVGTAILQQVDEGKLGLDDTLEKWLPGVIPNIDGNQITIRQMMQHMSGIESFTTDYTWSLTVYTDPTHQWIVPDQLLKMTQDLRAHDIQCNLVVPPGTEFIYSNTNFILLGMIAAKVDGFAQNEWQKVIEQRFFTRLHMENSRVPADDDTSLGSTNHGYVNFYNFYLNTNTGTSACSALTPPCQNEDIDITQQNMTNASSAGAIISTAKDLLTWINAELKGELLSEKIRKEQQTFTSTCKTTSSEAEAGPKSESMAGEVRRQAAPSAQGLFTIAEPRRPLADPSCEPASTHCDPTVEAGLAIFKQNKYGFIGHRGEIFGFDNTIQYLPEKDLTVVVLSNRTALSGNNVAPVPEQVAAVLYPDLKPQTDALSVPSIAASTH
ncbi:hypothetical protein CYFUS_007885 [Cystobacter fuscus]|uniref:Beta-lactamase-related domain-containing protein n=1 Tax=Cystobacter fuscus TaxID=43 RepID=A0A250JG01_9BACT|nr:serine hydrolase domain-containing protein [Cystobacter fuscus]ATB42407.1 hypothetical protein CYFUS_007885 [Cystobacter fuscus]